MKHKKHMGKSVAALALALVLLTGQVLPVLAVTWADVNDLKDDASALNSQKAQLESKLEELADNPAIIRNRRKIRAAVENARVFRDIQRERGTFSAYLWGFTGGGVIRETGKTRSELSDAVSKDLRRRGMTFVGTTIIYAYLQAVGVIDSHDRECFMYHENGK